MSKLKGRDHEKRGISSLTVLPTSCQGQPGNVNEMRRAVLYPLSHTPRRGDWRLKTRGVLRCMRRVGAAGGMSAGGALPPGHGTTGGPWSHVLTHFGVYGRWDCTALFNPQQPFLQAVGGNQILEKCRDQWGRPPNLFSNTRESTGDYDRVSCAP